MRPRSIARLITALVVATTPALASPDAAKDAAAQLERALAGASAPEMDAALNALVALDRPRAVDALLGVIEKTGARLRRGDHLVLVCALGRFSDAAALQRVAEAALESDGAALGRDLLLGLAPADRPGAVVVLRALLERGAPDLQLAAVDLLARRGGAAEVEALLAALDLDAKRTRPELQARIADALEGLAGVRHGDAAAWRAWWEAAREDWTPRVEDLARANVAAEVLDPVRRVELTRLPRERERILVITAEVPKGAAKDEPGRRRDHDQLELLLERSAVPHTAVPRAVFERDPRRHLAGAWTVLVNAAVVDDYCVCEECERLAVERAMEGKLRRRGRGAACPAECARHDRIRGQLSTGASEALARWAAAGGWLFVEDTGVYELGERQWPDVIQNSTWVVRSSDGRRVLERRELRELRVRIMPSAGAATHPLLRGVLTRGPVPGHLLLPDETPELVLAPRSRATVLLQTDDAVTGSVTWMANPGVVVTFPATKPRGRRRADDPWASELQGGRVIVAQGFAGHGAGRPRSEETPEEKAGRFLLEDVVLNVLLGSAAAHAEPR